MSNKYWDGNLASCHNDLRRLKQSLDACNHSNTSWYKKLHTDCTQEYDHCNSQLSVKDSRIRFLERRVQQQNYIATGLSVMCFTLTWIVASKRY
jgi:hypothetical protein